jgi:hypothetical protein
MEYLSGESFASVMKTIRNDDAPNPFWLSVRVIHDAARGLHTAHSLIGGDGEPLGVVHRDVSPQNIFVLYDGVTKVVDFGVARARGRLSTTQTNEVKGKLPYMAPEQFESLPIDARTDLWALGVVLWEATVGRRLFRGQSDAATISLIVQKPIPKPSDFVPGYPAKLENIIMRCLERDPAARYQTGDELADDLEELLYAFGKPAGASQVKKWMESHFAERITARESFLRGEAGAQRPSMDDSDSSSLSSIRQRLELEVAPEPTVANPKPRTLRAVPDSYPPEAKPRRWASALFAALVIAVLAAMIAVVAQRDPGDADVAVAPSHETTPTPEAEPIPAAPPAPESLALPVPEPSPEPAAADRAAALSPRVAERAPVREPEPEPERAPTPTPEPATPRPETEAQRVTETGMLSLIAIPAASVRIDGRAAGETPLRTSLSAGSHRVELRDPEGRSRTLNVQIAAGETTRQRVEF